MSFSWTLFINITYTMLSNKIYVIYPIIFIFLILHFHTKIMSSIFINANICKFILKLQNNKTILVFEFKRRILPINLTITSFEFSLECRTFTVQIMRIQFDLIFHKLINFSKLRYEFLLFDISWAHPEINFNVTIISLFEKMSSYHELAQFFFRCNWC
jgi:hypothetical protein